MSSVARSVGCKGGFSGRGLVKGWQSQVKLPGSGVEICRLQRTFRGVEGKECEPGAHGVSVSQKESPESRAAVHVLGLPGGPLNLLRGHLPAQRELRALILLGSQQSEPYIL